MNYQVLISGVVVLLFIACAVTRTALLRRRGVRAMVFGETDKSDYLLVIGFIALIYSAVARPLGLPMWGMLLKPFWKVSVPGWIGVCLCILALIGLIITLISFGDSFRVGIDEKTPSKLITGGVFAISRNPIYSCFFLMLAGQFLVHRNIVITAAAIFFMAMIHRQILREEKFLKKHYGEEYAAYCEKVRRYI